MPDWRPIDGFPSYEVSREGLVRNARTLHLLKPEIGHRGHLRVTLYNDDGSQRHLVHRLVLLHFVGPPPSEQHECAHWDGEPANNSVGNLRWATPKENSEDARRHGRLVVGEKCHFSKVGKDQAIEIRRRIVEGTSTHVLANEFGLNLSQVNRIACGAAWAHVSVLGRSVRPRRKVDESAAAHAIRAVEGGASVSEAARKFRCSRQSINRRRANRPLEKLVHAAVVEHWTKLGLPNTLVATLPNAGAMGQPGLTRGLPDLVVIAPELPVGFIELKRDEVSDISPEQRDFATLCMRLNIPYAICVGRDEPITMLEAWGAARRVAA